MTILSALRSKSNRIWIMIPAMALALADAGITLVFQSSDYWNQGFHLAVENNPLGRALMVLHPAVFLVGIVVWILIVTGLVLWLPHPWEHIVALTVILGHTWGVSIWLYQNASSAYWFRMSLFLVIALVTTACWRTAGGARRSVRPEIRSPANISQMDASQG